MSAIQDFTKGPLFKPLVLFSLPFMLANGLQVLYSVVDMLIVGRYVGEVGLAAISNAGRMFVFQTLLALGFSAAGQVYISQLVGQGRYRDLNQTIGTFFTFFILMGLGLTVFFLAFTKPFLNLMAVPDGTYRDSRLYLIICTAGLVFTYVYNMIAAVLRGLGDSFHPFLYIAIASAVNIVLDIVFIVCCGMGVAGAGLATSLGQIVSGLLSLSFLYRRRKQYQFDFRPERFRPDKAIVLAFLKLGLPLGMRYSLVNISMMIVLRMVNDYGTAAAAVFGIGCTIDDTITKMTQGIMQASTGIIGQNWGARHFGRIRRTVWYAWFLSASFYLPFGILIVCAPRFLFSFFSDSPSVLELAPVFVNAIVWSFPALVLLRGTNGFVNGIGNMKLAFLLGLLDSLVLRVGLCWLLGSYLGYGFQGYVFAFGTSVYGLCLPVLVYFFFLNWERRGLSTAPENTCPALHKDLL